MTFRQFDNQDNSHWTSSNPFCLCVHRFRSRHDNLESAMMPNRFAFVVYIFILIIGISVYCPSVYALQGVQDQETVAVQTETEQEKIVPSPNNIKEKTGIIVFVVWIWLSIFVLVYFLRLKIKETDRLEQLKFFSSTKD